MFMLNKISESGSEGYICMTGIYSCQQRRSSYILILL